MPKELIVLKKLEDGSLEADIDYTDDVFGNIGLLLYFACKKMDMSYAEFMKEVIDNSILWQVHGDSHSQFFGYSNDK